jgi:hypothetical protein
MAAAPHCLPKNRRMSYFGVVLDSKWIIVGFPPCRYPAGWFVFGRQAAAPSSEGVACGGAIQFETICNTEEKEND